MPSKTDKSSIVRFEPSPAVQDAEYETGEPRPHHRFYVEDGNMMLQVNNALFRVHRSTLIKHSTVLGDMLSLPRPSHASSSDQNTMMDSHVELTGDSVVGWECLLGVLYPESPFTPVLYTTKQWAWIVMLANKYVMDGIEANALLHLQNTSPPLEPIDLMVLAQKVRSEELYAEALQTLSRQNQLMSLEDAWKIGLRSFYEVVTEHLKYWRDHVPGTLSKSQPLTTDRLSLLQKQIRLQEWAARNCGDL